MNYSPVRNAILPALVILLVLANPLYLLAATESSDAITKLQQLRSSQNRQTMIANIKASSTEVTRGDVEVTGLAFKQALLENKQRLMPEITSGRAPDFHSITPSYDLERTINTGSMAKTAVAASPDIFVNGKTADTLLIGSEPYFSITLPSALEGILIIYWDRNHNGITDSVDIPIEEYDFMDNDQHDLNPADNVFEFLYDQEMADGLNYVVDDFLYTVYTNDGKADAAVTYYVDPSPFYVTGIVRDIVTNDPLDGVIVWGDYAWYDMGPMPMEEDQGPTIIAITDTAGVYTLFFPDTGYVIVGTWDHLRTTGGLIPEPPQYELPLLGAETVDFYYRAPLARIWGYVEDDAGNPLFDIEVRAFHDYYDCPECSDGGGDDGGDGGGGEFYGYTDSSGFYEIGVDPDYFRVEIDGKDLIPDYMIPEGQSLDVTETGVNTADFVLLVPNNSIAGTVLLDGVPYPDAIVHAWSWEFGWNVVWTDMSGNYDMPVYDPIGVTFTDSTGPGGYELRVHLDEDPGMMNPIIQVSENWNVLPGTTGEDILLQTVTGGIYGTFYNAQDNQPILDGWDVGLEAMNLDNEMHFWTRPNEHDGTYQLWLVDGTYRISAGGMDWYGPEPDTIVISGGMIDFDIYLEPVTYQGIFDGRVLDEITNSPISNAEINISGEFWGNRIFSDTDGYFQFKLPNGYYSYHIMAPGYRDYSGDVDIDNNQIYHEIKLQELVIDGVKYGFVSSALAPVPNASVSIWNPATGYGNHTMTDSAGQYWFELPNGIYDISVDHPDFLQYWGSGLWVSNDTTSYDIDLAHAEGFISGRVFDDEGLAIHDASIWVVSMDSTNYFDYGSGVDDNGNFRIPVVNGIYEVHVDAPGYIHSYVQDVLIQNNDVYFDFGMVKRAFEGPAIYTVTDQPDDQGRWVHIEFGPDGNDPNKYIGYSIWRWGLNPSYGYWEWQAIAYIKNMTWSSYSLVAPTLMDFHPDLLLSDYETEFMVTGHYDDWNFADGGHNWGYSIDNIVPGVPGGFTLTAITTTYSDLQWDVSADDDFQYFELYRSNDGDFAGLAPIAQLVETNFRDEVSNAGNVFHYVLKAVDANGNTSDASRVVRTFTTSLDGKEQLPEEYSLNQNYPNPFNPTTMIEFALPVASDISLEVYNIQGQRVRTLANGVVQAGYLSIKWDGMDQNGKELSSGTYIYRLKAADLSFTKKMVLMK